MIAAQRNSILGSARVSRAGDGVPAVANFSKVVDLVFARHLCFASLGKFVAVEHRNQHARRARYPAQDSLAP